MATSTTPPHTSATMYGLQRPDLPEAAQAVRRVCGHNTDGVWQQLLTSAGLTGHETDHDSMNRLLTAMRAGTPILAMCAQALTIRAETYDRLTAAHDLIRSAEGTPCPPH